MAKNLKNGQKPITTSNQSISEEEKHLQTLSSHEHIYEFYEKTGELVGFAPHIRGDVVTAYRHFHPYFHYNDGCAVCILEMINTVYSWYKKHKSTNV